MTTFRIFSRHLRRSPATSLVIVLTLAFGVGLSTAVFSVVHGAVLRPLGYSRPAELVAVHAAFLRAGLEGMGLSGPEVVELSTLDTGLRGIGAFAFRGGVTVQANHATQASLAFVTPGLLPTLGVEPLHGTGFDAQGEPADGIVLLHAFWLSAFGADPAIVGRSVLVNGGHRRVIGVMPPRFDLLDHEVDLLGPLPLAEASAANRTNHSYTVIGRLPERVTAEAAQARLDAVVATWLQRVPSAHAPNPAAHPLRLVPLHDVVTAGARPLLLTVLGAVTLVMLIACVNVANLLLARAERHRRETAIHLALGASRSRVLRQWLAEGVLWSSSGTVFGCGLAWLLVRLVVSLEPEGIPRLTEVGLDAAALGYASALAIFTGVLFGLIPGLRLTTAQPGRVLGSDRSGTSAGRQVLRHSLIVTEIALAVVLVAGSALMIRSFLNLANVDPGFSTTGVWRMSATFPSRDYPTTGHYLAATESLRTRLTAQPSIASVGLMSGLPPRREPNRSTFRVEGRAVDPEAAPSLVDFVQICDEGFFDTLHVRLVEGRFLAAADSASAQPVVVINEAMARRFFPGISPVGQRIVAGGPPGAVRPWMTVVGVVGDMRQGGLQALPGTEVFVPLAQAETSLGFLPRTINVVARMAGDIEGGGVLRAELQAVAPGVPAIGLRTMEDVVARAIARPRFLTLLLLTFGAGALALAATGIYSVVSYLVGLRTREFGIRIALGSTARGVRQLVLRQSLLSTAAGVALGLIAARWAVRLLASQLFEVSAGDTLTTVLATLVLTASALFAADIPARRAARLDPLEALRRE